MLKLSNVKKKSFTKSGLCNIKIFFFYLGLKELLNFVWSHESSRIVTLITTSTIFSELPSIFHCLDEHGLFTDFVSIKPHSNKVVSFYEKFTLFV
jgi:hypothetical protein